ncbi:SPOR domain-containing protein [Novosphingobium sp. ZW T3_23]|uniref:SPOR domain-containing protein n=1 Tax=Novosphingobium sp. ZW T3_23 TaxID=3378084 RepID=UPI0038543C5F
MANWGQNQEAGDLSAARSPAGFENSEQAPNKLELGDGDVRLPWLEGEDEEFEDQQGGASGQTLLLVALAVVAILVIVGGIWWATRQNAEQPLVASGGVIEAPKEPYKTRPENPGGDIVAGTGDTSYAVAEGQSRVPRIDQRDVPAPAAAVPPVTQPSPEAKPSATASAKPEPVVNGVGVQVGAYTSKSTAEAGWGALKVQYPALSGVNHRIVEGQADIGKVYRLQAVPGDLAAARALCSGMRSAGLSCQVKQ